MATAKKPTTRKPTTPPVVQRILPPDPTAEKRAMERDAIAEEMTARLATISPAQRTPAVVARVEREATAGVRKATRAPRTATKRR